MSELILTDGQRKAVDIIKERYENKEPLTIVSGAAGTGKAMPVDMVIPTPNGKRRFGTLKVGDSIYGIDGSPTFITGVFPQGDLDAYRITFSDGRQTVCNNEHLWATVNVRGEDQRVNTLEELMKENYRVRFLPNIYPAQRNRVDLPVSPFLIGFFMKRGWVDNRGNVVISTRKNTLLNPAILEELTSLGVEMARTREKKRADLSNRRSKDPEVEILFLKADSKPLKWVDIQKYFPSTMKPKAQERVIPPGYLRGSVGQRYALLQGFLLSSIGKKGRTMDPKKQMTIWFSLARPGLAEQIKELLHSLGIVFFSDISDGRIRVRLKLTRNQKKLLFSKTHHYDWGALPKTKYYTRIKSIEKLDRKINMMCISVSAKDKLFLAEHYIPTHNTTVVNTIIDELELNKEQVLFATYTGKAAKVLQSKGVPAKTIHKSFYSSRLFTPKGREPYFVHEPLSGIDFHKSFPHNSCRLIVLDEASMVSGEMLDIIKSYGVPIICLGDNYQLGPVEREGSSDLPGVAKLLKEPHVELTEIMRQAQGSGIIQVGQLLRQGIVPEPGDYGSDMKVIRMSQMHMGMLRWADQILVSKNTTRKQYNQMMRSELGFNSKLPEPGEKLICLKNVWESESSTGQPLINGATVIVDSFEPAKAGAADMKARDMADDGEYEGAVLLDNFKATKRKTLTRANAKLWDFDYGYAISIWKSQGSQWPKVVVVGEYHQQQTSEEYTQMLYTAITRAEKACVLVLPF